jgi:hypothetical protein
VFVGDLFGTKSRLGDLATDHENTLRHASKGNLPREMHSKRQLGKQFNM